jgi:pimeloyl-ACP methyl ester carboxylesterase
MRAKELFDIPVRGGSLRVARWAGEEDVPVVVGVHGLTANHLNFAWLSKALGGDVTLIAPDLRGRGRSSDLPPPFGMRTHAEDLVAVLDHLQLERATFVGHSMGGFVVPVVATHFPDRVRALVVVDGGVELGELPQGVDIEEVVRFVVGPSLDRLKMTFPTREAYLDFWRPHPSLKGAWSDQLEEYFDYDLVGEPGNFRSCVSLQAVLDDSSSELGDPGIVGAIGRVTQPMTFICAERGVMNQTPGLYSEEAVARLHEIVPHVQSMKVDANHWTLLMGPGAPLVAEQVRKVCRS